jgi:hypothetical protein
MLESAVEVDPPSFKVLQRPHLSRVEFQMANNLSKGKSLTLY